MRQLRLQKHSQFIRCRKRSFRLTVGMEADAVNAVAAIFQQNLFPFRNCHGCMPGLRVFCAICLTPQKNCPAVQCQSAAAVITKRADAETGPVFIGAVPSVLCRHTAIQGCNHLIEIALIFVPKFHVLAQWQIVEPDFHYFRILLFIRSGFR